MAFGFLLPSDDWSGRRWCLSDTVVAFLDWGSEFFPQLQMWKPGDFITRHQFRPDDVCHGNHRRLMHYDGKNPRYIRELFSR